MLILNFIDGCEVAFKKGGRFRKKTEKTALNRYSINVNGKLITVLDLCEKNLECEEVLTLLKIYKGRVLVSQNFSNEDRLKEYLFNPEVYYQRALISSLINQIKTINKDWKRICVKIDNFISFKELYELVRISKTVTILTVNSIYTEKFLKDCYNDYGAIVNVKKDISTQVNDVFLDLNGIDNKGKLMINVKGKDFLLYPDTKYFDNCNEYQKLLPYNLEHNIICSAFSDK